MESAIDDPALWIVFFAQLESIIPPFLHNDGIKNEGISSQLFFRVIKI
jgi:hypothetical protein